MPRRGVDDVAGRHAFSRVGSRVERDERLARGDADAHLELTVLGERFADRQRRPNGSLRVVLVRDRRAEDGHDRVADELLDRSAEALELGAHARVVGLQEPRARPRGPCARRGREADEIAEEAGDDLALLALRRRGERRCAHAEQKRASTAFSRPQLGQIVTQRRIGRWLDGAL